MPHIIVKIWPGRSEEKKQELADTLAASLVEVLGSRDSAVSVAIEEIPSDEWAETVYRTEIMGAGDKLYKKPGYEM